MTTYAQTRYADDTSYIDNIHEEAFLVVRAQNLLAPTVLSFTDATGMQPRDVTQYAATTMRAAAEGEDVTPEQFTRSALSTLTPARHANQIFITDQNIATNNQDVAANAALELGASAAKDVDVAIGSDFTSLTGGTVGTSSGTLTMTSVSRAVAILRTGSVPGPYYCVLHPYQWQRIFEANTAYNAAFSMAPAFQDRMIQNYFVTQLLGDVTFVITPNLTVTSNYTTGALYAPSALGLDIRKAYNLRPERDESKEGVELNASMWYAHGVWRPLRGVQLVGVATLPT